MTLQVVVDGVTFHDSESDPGFVVVDFEGWNDGPGARGNETPRTAAHGDHDEPVYRGSRLIILSGWCEGSDPSDLGVLSDQFKGILSDGSPGEITVTEFGVTRTATVKLWGDLRFTPRGVGNYAGWSIRFKSADGRRYGATHTEGPDTSVDVSHAGNFPAVSSIEVVGTMPSGYTVTDGTTEYVVTQALAGGQTHRIDMATGWLYLDDVLQAGAVQQADTWVVPKATTVTHTLVPVSGSGTITVTVRDTYM
jgi:hypothetical protein